MAELVARMYSKAIFDSAVEENVLDSVTEEFDRFMSLYDEAEAVLCAPTVRSGNKRELIETMRLEGLFRSFVHLLLEKGRIDLVREIKEDFDRFVEEKNKIARAIVQSAVPLTEDQLNRLKGNLEKSTGMRVRMETQVVPEIIGGVVVRIGDKVIDGSVKRKMEYMLESIREIK